MLDVSGLLALLNSAPQPIGPSRFGLDWPGRQDALRLLREPSRGTLRPDLTTSVDFADAEHVFIAGETLEVMKLLQKAYFGAFRMIYLNPPYNTGDDFVYIDDTEDPLRGYLRFLDKTTAGGDRAEPTASGRFHSRWLTMMLPRLYAARNLLAENGVAFVSIDDHEVHHLRMLMDEVFGEENFVCTFVWEKRYSPPPDTKDVGYVTENILCYRRAPPSS